MNHSFQAPPPDGRDHDSTVWLDWYIWDYLRKRDLQCAALFKQEAKVPDRPSGVVVDTPLSFIYEWFLVFWEVYFARTHSVHQSEAAVNYLEEQKRQRMQQQLHLRRLQEQQMIRRQMMASGEVGNVPMKMDVMRPGAMAGPMSGMDRTGSVPGAMTSPRMVGPGPQLPSQVPPGMAGSSPHPHMKEMGGMSGNPHWQSAGSMGGMQSSQMMPSSGQRMQGMGGLTRQEHLANLQRLQAAGRLDPAMHQEILQRLNSSSGPGSRSNQMMSDDMMEAPFGNPGSGQGPGSGPSASPSLGPSSNQQAMMMRQQQQQQHHHQQQQHMQTMYSGSPMPESNAEMSRKAHMQQQMQQMQAMKAAGMGSRSGSDIYNMGVAGGPSPPGQGMPASSSSPALAHTSPNMQQQSSQGPTSQQQSQGQGQMAPRAQTPGTPSTPPGSMPVAMPVGNGWPGQGPGGKGGPGNGPNGQLPPTGPEPIGKGRGARSRGAAAAPVATTRKRKTPTGQAMERQGSGTMGQGVPSMDSGSSGGAQQGGQGGGGWQDSGPHSNDGGGGQYEQMYGMDPNQVNINPSRLLDEMLPDELDFPQHDFDGAFLGQGDDEAALADRMLGGVQDMVALGGGGGGVRGMGMDDGGGGGGSKRSKSDGH